MDREIVLWELEQIPGYMGQKVHDTGSRKCRMIEYAEHAIASLKEQKNEQERIIRIIRETLHDTHSLDTEEDKDFVCDLLEHRIRSEYGRAD